MASSSGTVDLPLTLHLSKAATDSLAERASASGTDLAGYVSALVEQTAIPPRSLVEISGPVYDNFLASGMTDDELGELLEAEKHEARARRRARPT